MVFGRQQPVSAGRLHLELVAAHYTTSLQHGLVGAQEVQASEGRGGQAVSVQLHDTLLTFELRHLAEGDHGGLLVETASRLAVEHRPLYLLLIVVDGIRESVDYVRLQLPDPPRRHHALSGLHDPRD